MGIKKALSRWRKEDQRNEDRDLQIDSKNFIDDIGTLMTKYSVGMEAVLDIRPEGIIPRLKISRLKNELPPTNSSKG